MVKVKPIRRESHDLFPATILDIDQLRQEYSIPDNIEIVNVPIDQVKMKKEWDSDQIFLFSSYFKAGLRLPMHPFTRAVLRYCRIAPSLGSANFYRMISGFIHLGSLTGVEMQLEDLHHRYILKRYTSYGYYWKTRVHKDRIITGLKQSEKNWDKYPLMVTGGWEFGEGEDTRFPIPRAQGIPDVTFLNKVGREPTEHFRRIEKVLSFSEEDRHWKNLATAFYSDSSYRASSKVASSSTAAGENMSKRPAAAAEELPSLPNFANVEIEIGEVSQPRKRLRGGPGRKVTPPSGLARGATPSATSEEVIDRMPLRMAMPLIAAEGPSVAKVEPIKVDSSPSPPNVNRAVPSVPTPTPAPASASTSTSTSRVRAPWPAPLIPPPGAGGKFIGVAPDQASLRSPSPAPPAVGASQTASPSVLPSTLFLPRFTLPGSQDQVTMGHQVLGNEALTRLVLGNMTTSADSQRLKNMSTNQLFKYAEVSSYQNAFFVSELEKRAGEKNSRLRDLERQMAELKARPHEAEAKLREAEKTLLDRSQRLQEVLDRLEKVEAKAGKVDGLEQSLERLRNDLSREKEEKVKAVQDVSLTQNEKEDLLKKHSDQLAQITEVHSKALEAERESVEGLIAVRLVEIVEHYKKELLKQCKQAKLNGFEQGRIHAWAEMEVAEAEEQAAEGTEASQPEGVPPSDAPAS